MQRLTEALGPTSVVSEESDSQCYPSVGVRQLKSVEISGGKQAVLRSAPRTALLKALSGVRRAFTG